MSKAWAMKLLALATLLMAGCGQTSPGTGVASDSRHSSPTAVAANASQLPCGARGSCLVIVTLRGSDLLVIRDITDIAHPKTLGNLGHVTTGAAVDQYGREILGPVFRDGAFVTYDDGHDMWGLPVASTELQSLGPYPGIQEYRWSPDGKEVVLNHGGSSATSPTDLHLLWGDSGVLIGTLPALGVGGCEAIANCTIPNWLDFQLRFSPNGSLISLVVDSFSGSVFRLWDSKGKLIKNDDSRGWTMSVWSGNGLYFRGDSGVVGMRDGQVASFLTGVAWIKPSASPGGGSIVYSARDASGWAHTFVVDTATRQVRELNKARTGAVFLTSRYIWYQGERECVPSDNCGSDPPIHPLSGKTYIYDLQDGTETESIITRVYDAWPHAA